MGEEAIHIRITLSPGDPLGEKFVRIKGELGLKNSVEVVRALISRYHLRREA